MISNFALLQHTKIFNLLIFLWLWNKSWRTGIKALPVEYKVRSEEWKCLVLTWLKCLLYPNDTLLEWYLNNGLRVRYSDVKFMIQIMDKMSVV